MCIKNNEKLLALFENFATIDLQQVATSANGVKQ